jgi:phosphatidylglycerophosphatase A
LNTFQKHIATAGPAGYLPASGTWGSLVALLPLLFFYGRDTWTMALTLAILSVLGFLYGVSLAYDAELLWGEDPKEFVWDEVIGMWITLIGHAFGWKQMLFGFLLFRFFDIFKPLGIRRLEKYQDGWGVMLDDVAAGVCANVCLWVIFYAIS